MRSIAIFFLSALGLAIPGLARSATPAGDAPRLVFATVVSGWTQGRKAEVLIDSIRAFAGRYSQAPIYVVVDESQGEMPPELRRDGIHILPLAIPEVARDFLFANKVYAAAQVEALVADSAETLVWMDPTTLVLAPPEALDLGAAGPAVALRPVFLSNRIGLDPEAEASGFWPRILAETEVDLESMPIVRSFVHQEPIRFYINCGIIAYRPSRGICREWASVFTRLLADDAYRYASVAHLRDRIFFHQAVLSAVILARSTAEERRWLPDDHGYPLGHHSELPEERKARRLEDLRCLIYDTLWDQDPGWMERIAVDEPLRGWLESAYFGSLRVTDRILREEGSCNSYLITTDAGNVILDPGGTDRPGSGLLRIQGERPVAAVLLTHGHADHRSGIAAWRRREDVPVIAERHHPELLRELDEMAGFFAFRNAIIAGETPPAEPPEPEPTPLEASELFAERYLLEVGDLHFELVSTPGETPDTATVWIPELGAVFVADNFFSEFPNLATPRGSRPRWARDYVAALETAIAWQPRLLLPGHGEPIVGRQTVRERLEAYRDAIVTVHDAVLAGMNQGRDVYTLMREISLPEGIDLGEGFGRVPWAVRGIYQNHGGWFDGSTVALFDLAPTALYPELVALAGGTAPVVERARQLLESDAAPMALLLTDAVLALEPDHRAALALRVEVLRSLFKHSRNYLQQSFLVHDYRTSQQHLESLPADVEE